MKLITGHNLMQPPAERAPLEFTTDPGMVAEFRKAVDAIAAKRRVADEPHGVISAKDIGLNLSDLEDAA